MGLREAKAWSSLLKYPTDGHRDSKWNRKSFDGKWIRRIVLAIRQSLQVENPVAAGATEIAAENDHAQFKRAFLARKDKAHNAPEDLIFAE